MANSELSDTTENEDCYHCLVKRLHECQKWHMKKEQLLDLIAQKHFLEDTRRGAEKNSLLVPLQVAQTRRGTNNLQKEATEKQRVSADRDATTLSTTYNRKKPRGSNRTDQAASKKGKNLKKRTTKVD